MTSFFRARRATFGLALCAALAPLAGRGQPASPTVRLRGTIEALTPTRVTLRERSGERIELALAPNLVVTEVYPVTLAEVRAGSFIGVGALPQADGSQRAIAVTLFPEAMRGTGEGHRPFDFLPQSTMTNATVADVAAAADGRKLVVKYKDGEKTIVVPPEVPIVSLRPADRALLVVGGAVAITAQSIDGQPTAQRISAGRGGFAPPY
ncbi:hypothetical protein FN976_09485 [Caenimonas sedimenti]|uniref:DUF5666 domain-containing protein n=1 Tax=Caenimonas sedimenti TaxID=2596921 RepID=A0A562ZTA7_9BURK|nr:hypothetical protein [Caenimonas sedimenti]TWO71596.1 hypothetical protein FN976_09485 [Caenimonas sedimenti]